MSAPVTEAHRAITESVFELLDSVEMVGPSPAERAAQLIADSEARACDQLRAEVERLNRDYDYDHKCLHEVRERCELWKQRAESAEREVERLKKYSANLENDVKYLTQGVPEGDPLFLAVARAERAEAELAASRYETVKAAQDGLRECIRAERAEADANSTRERALTLAATLDEAQAELAAERARLDWLELRGPWDSWNGFGETGITLRENIRAGIDAAMKEGAK